MQGLVIRRPHKEDVKALNDFFDVVIKDTFEQNDIADLLEDYEKEIKEEKMQFLKEDLNSNGHDRFYLFATIFDKLIGTITYGPSNDDINSNTNGEFRDIIEIGSVFVHPDYQRKGIGSLLLNRIYKELEKKGIEEFCLDSGYKNAQKVWIKKYRNPQYCFENYWGEGAHYMIWKVKLLDVLDK